VERLDLGSQLSLLGGRVVVVAGLVVVIRIAVYYPAHKGQASVPPQLEMERAFLR
jgi:hypothetical protein